MPRGVPTASSRVALACRSQCQLTPVSPSLLQVGLSCLLTGEDIATGAEHTTVTTSDGQSALQVALTAMLSVVETANPLAVTVTLYVPSGR